ncbi:c-type cytochrome [Fodinicurvata fenggangensis]|uniref:c-type cytochrome n=1 Tax=Fodinicurvata fenggangensis TaxID=1121830 RepID=UPI00047B22CE|nr:c-type cytochrome [Fodinicurvata fenggangensis]
MIRHGLCLGAFLAALTAIAGLMLQVDAPVARAQSQSVYGDAERGRTLFQQRCGSCHEIEDSWGRPQDAPISAEEMANNSRMSLDYLTTVQAGAGPVHASLPPFFFDSQQEEDLQAFFENLQ